jgi:hypothetical protein
MTSSDFMRLNNSDATVDVICLDCFRVVAQAREQHDFGAAEMDHICETSDLVVLRYGSSSSSRGGAANVAG